MPVAQYDYLSCAGTIPFIISPALNSLIFEQTIKESEIKKQEKVTKAEIPMPATPSDPPRLSPLC
jgi:hypothetical protein